MIMITVHNVCRRSSSEEAAWASKHVHTGTGIVTKKGQARRYLVPPSLPVYA